MSGGHPRASNAAGGGYKGRISTNLMRRNLTKGQKAMALAMIYPDPDERGRGKKSAAIKSAEASGFTSRRLNQAREVLRYSRPMAEGVRDGTPTLDEALAKVKQEQQFQQSDEVRKVLVSSGW